MKYNRPVIQYITIIDTLLPIPADFSGTAAINSVNASKIQKFFGHPVAAS